jgi:hypothetical protein
MPTSENSNKNGTIALLSRLAQSGHPYVQLGILVLVGLSGLGNWVATWNSANRNKDEIEVSRRVNYEGQQRIREEVARQVSEIHRWINESRDEFHNGNKDSAANRQMLEDVTKKIDELTKKPEH